MDIKCSYCGQVNTDSEYGYFCEFCGEKLEQKNTCPKCGAILKEGVKFCRDCGTKFDGLFIGDKNVIGGDVIGSKEENKYYGSTTVIKNVDDTKKLSICSICRKHLLITEGYSCPVCGNHICNDCYDQKNKLCPECKKTEAVNLQKKGTQLLEKNNPKAIEILLKALEFGNDNPELLLQLGICHERGIGTPKDPKEAAKWFTKAFEKGAGIPSDIMKELGDSFANDVDRFNWYLKAAEQGDVEAQSIIGDCYYYGRGIGKNYEKAAEWYVKAYDKGHLTASVWVLNDLGHRYFEGNGVKKDLNEATRWWRLAADEGDANSQSNLGHCYYNGYGVQRDYEAAVSLWKKAEPDDNGYSSEMLGKCYYYGIGVEKNISEAAAWYQKAMKKGRQISASIISEIANCYLNGVGVSQNIIEAEKWLIQALAKDETSVSSDAMMKLGDSFFTGTGTDKDYVKASKYYDKAISLGASVPVETMKDLANCFDKGDCVPMDYETALKWYRCAAELGDADSQNNLGNHYRDGLGVKKNPLIAYRWYSKAAELENPLGMLNLGECFFYGIGVDLDYSKALSWFEKASVLGIADAQSRLVEYYIRSNDINHALELVDKYGKENISPDILNSLYEFHKQSEIDSKNREKELERNRLNYRRRLPTLTITFFIALTILILGSFTTLIPDKIIPLIVFVILGFMTVYSRNNDSGTYKEIGVYSSVFIYFVLKYIFTIVSDIVAGIHFGFFGFVFKEIIWKIIKVLILFIFNSNGGFFWASDFVNNSFFLSILDPLVFVYIYSLFRAKKDQKLPIIIVLINLFFSVGYLVKA